MSLGVARRRGGGSPENDARGVDPSRQLQVEERQVELLLTPLDIQPRSERDPVGDQRVAATQVAQRGGEGCGGLRRACQRVHLLFRGQPLPFKRLAFHICPWVASRMVGFRAWGAESRVQGASGCRVRGPGSRIQGVGFRVCGLGFRVEGLGFRVDGLGFRVEDSG